MAPFGALVPNFQTHTVLPVYLSAHEVNWNWSDDRTFRNEIGKKNSLQIVWGRNVSIMTEFVEHKCSNDRNRKWVLYFNRATFDILLKPIKIYLVELTELQIRKQMLRRKWIIDSEIFSRLK